MTKILDKGRLSKNISSLSTGVIISYALCILIGFIIYLSYYFVQFNLVGILIILLLLMGNAESPRIR
jgi:hypothetical protein